MRITSSIAFIINNRRVAVIISSIKTQLIKMIYPINTYQPVSMAFPVPTQVPLYSSGYQTFPSPMVYSPFHAYFPAQQYSPPTKRKISFSLIKIKIIFVFSSTSSDSV